MNQDSPAITVLIAVHNGEEYIRETLDSICAQTFRDFECLLINDFSTDGTPAILEEYAARDSRFVIHHNEVNLRLAASLNVGIELARGKYIVRLDADDISLPKRLEKQFRYMEAHPDVSVSYCKHFLLQDGSIHAANSGKRRKPEDVAACFLFFCPVLHPGVIVRSDVMKKYRFNPERTCSEDMDLWTRMLLDGEKITCQDEFLVLYRIHGGQITAGSSEKQKKEAAVILRNYYSALFGEELDEFFDFLINGMYFGEKKDLARSFAFHQALLQANEKHKRFNKRAIDTGFQESMLATNYEVHFTFSDYVAFLKILKFKAITRYTTAFLRLMHDIRKSSVRAISCGYRFKWRVYHFIPYFRYPASK